MTDYRCFDYDSTVERTGYPRPSNKYRRGTMHSVSFYSTLHLPVHEGIELVLILNQQPIPVRPTQTIELDNGQM
ncbi:hypothetical protein [Exiguobacterium antarcticum]|uniref:hypothetical protein n=1 Tax=Exiguobacterium antarcticum TaxID=132920 RepID=UPI0011D25BC5|nr:hypothetical protein [Exiguobacterium antarcticum]